MGKEAGVGSPAFDEDVNLDSLRVADIFLAEDGQRSIRYRPATLEDLGGEKVWYCEYGNVKRLLAHECAGGPKCGWRLLIPLPQMVAGESL